MTVANTILDIFTATTGMATLIKTTGGRTAAPPAKKGRKEKL